MADIAPILIVDDDPGLRALVAATLELEGHAVVTAADGAVALDLVDKHKPVLILLDKNMPRLDGPAFARELRSKGQTMPIVVVSGSEGGKRFAREINAHSYIRKPFKVPQLLAIVSEFMSKLSDEPFGKPLPGTIN